MEQKQSEFIKLGENIVVKPKGSDYDLIPGQVYTLDFNRWTESDEFKETNNLNLPDKVYETSEDKLFKNRVISYFNTHPDKDTGVMLAGEKGTGKTILSKALALESKLPIIIINPDYPEHRLVHFFKGFTTPVCILIDEIEKNFDTRKMLEFLDGVQKTSKKLIIMTCNNLEDTSEFLQDRCSRVRYLRKYKASDNLELINIIADDLNVKNKDKVVKFCKEHLALPSVDNINSLLNEIKDLEDTDCSIEQAAKYLNITLK